MSILSDIPLNNFSVYWVRCKWHTNYFTQGYIGISSNIDRRFKEHKSKGASSSQHLKNAIDKYKEDIVFDILFSGLEEELALLIELELRSEPSIGWNIAMGGGLPPRMWGNKYRAGLTLSEEHLRALRGRVLSEEHKKNISLGGMGRKLSEDTRAKISLANSTCVNIYIKDTMELIASNVLVPIWCNENGYCAKSITRVASGARKSHRGLFVVKVNKEDLC